MCSAERGVNLRTARGRGVSGALPSRSGLPAALAYAGPVASREDIGSWLEGDPAGGAGRSGSRLGLPDSGPGSPATVLRRAVALMIDWVACLAIASAFFDGAALAPLAVFAVENLLLVSTLGSTLGHRIVGIRVRRAPVRTPDGSLTVPAQGSGPGFVAGAVRTVLLCLVIPAVVWDADGRGMHDRAAGTVIVRA